MPPIRPGQLDCLAVMTVLGWILRVLLGATLGLGPVTVKTIGPGVTDRITVRAIVFPVDMFRNMLVLCTVLVSAWVLALVVRVDPYRPTFLAWFP